MADIFGNLLRSAAETAVKHSGMGDERQKREESERQKSQQELVNLINIIKITPLNDPSRAQFMEKARALIGATGLGRPTGQRGAFGGIQPQAGKFRGYKKPTIRVDEFGQATETYAPKERKTPKEKVMRQLYKKHKKGTLTAEEQKMWQKMLVGQPLVEIGVGEPASAAERKAIASGRASLDALGNLKQLFDKTKTKTGPIAGRIAPTAGLFGLTSDEQESFMAATSAFKNAIIKEITGAQMSEVEAKRIMKQVPDITDPPARWQAKWEQSKKNLEMLQKRRLEILQQSGLRVPAGASEITIREESIPDDIRNMSDEELRSIAERK